MRDRHMASTLFVSLLLTACFSLIRGPLYAQKNDLPLPSSLPQHINTNGKTILERFLPPEGFERKAVPKGSFADYLRTLPLKIHGSLVHYYDGGKKQAKVYYAVVDIDVGSKDLQQCADAIMRLRAEFFYSKKEYEKISFTLTNGFRVDYKEWMKGMRLQVKGNKTSWVKTAEPSNMYASFRRYLGMVFTYAGTLSLSKELRRKDISDIAIGDVFILGGSPGHAVLVVDIAEDKNGKKVFLLAQSYMPAQDIQILKNPEDTTLSPWYSIDFGDILKTPEWTFDRGSLKTW